MKNNLISITAILLALTVGLVVVLKPTATPEVVVKGNEPIVLRGAGTEVTHCFSAGGAATTSITYVGQGAATTTLISNCPIDKATETSLDFIVGATATPPVTVYFSRYFSHDGGTWFGESNQTLVSNTLTTIGSGSTTVIRYVHAGTGTTTKSTPLSSVAARFMRLDVFVSGGDGAYIKAIITKREGLGR